MIKIVRSFRANHSYELDHRTMGSYGAILCLPGTWACDCFNSDETFEWTSHKNHFYKANRELERIFKTGHVLKYMADITLRQRTGRGLLKSEELNGLARDLNYGKRGEINKQDWLEQKNSCSCLTLILACIIYWQAKEIHRILLQTPE